MDEGVARLCSTLAGGGQARAEFCWNSPACRDKESGIASKDFYLQKKSHFLFLKGSHFFPSTLPSIMTGLRLGFNLAFIGVILGEMAASKSGLGYALMKSEGAFYMEKIICIVVVLAVIAIPVNYLYDVFEERLIRVRAR